MVPIYRYFGGEHESLDYSEESLQEMFLWETYGIGDLGLGLFRSDEINGFAVGKHWMDVTVKMWNQDILLGHLGKDELRKEFPDWIWWLERVLKR